MDVTVCGTAEKIVMIEAGAKEVPEDQTCWMHLLFAHEEIKKMCRIHRGHPGRDRQAEVRVRASSMSITTCSTGSKHSHAPRSKFAFDTDDKTVRDARMQASPRKRSTRSCGEEAATERAAEISEIVDKLCKKVSSATG